MTPKPLLILLLCALLVVPTMASPVPSGIFSDAQTIDIPSTTTLYYNVTPGDAIGSVVFTMDLNTNVSYTLGYGVGNTVSGKIEYVGVPVYTGSSLSYQSTAYVSMGSNSSSSTFFDITGNVVKRFGVTGHAKDDSVGTMGFAAWDTSILNAYTSQNIAYYPVVDVAKKPIYWFSFTSNKPVTITVSYGPQSYIQTQSTKSGIDILNEWVSLATQYGSTILSVVISLIYWLKFFFIDNLGLTVALYISGSLAFAARSCRGNPIRLLRTFFKDQKALFEFIITLWEKLVNIISSFRGIFRI